MEFIIQLVNRSLEDKIEIYSDMFYCEVSGSAIYDVTIKSMSLTDFGKKSIDERNLKGLSLGDIGSLIKSYIFNGYR